ncbi:MAG: hypothetical protein M3534_13970 [Actinomycetota bacterium]|nr:hypothetical protein [Actinomycetota bacterium]
MEETNTRNGDGRRLVLGFDAGCVTCSELARGIEERVGDKVEIRSLYDPQMEHWREQALGKDAAWAPTLVELNGGPVRAWTGVRMGARLSRVLGPVATWRVMQELGEANTDLELADSAAVRAVSGLSRGQFLKGVGGAAVALSILSGTGNLAAPAGAASVRYEEISGKELLKVARAVVSRRDVANVTGQAWRDRVRSGGAIDAEIGKAERERTVIEAIDLGDGRISSEGGKPAFSGDLAVVKAARHSLSDGNSVLAISFAMPKKNRLVVYHEYEKPTFLPKDQVKTKAEALVYEVEGESLVLKKASSNGGLQVMQQAGARLSCGNDKYCNHACDIAYGYSPCIRVRGIGCIAYQCRACAITCWGGLLLCGACAVVICSWGVIRECCRGGYGCKRCGLCK